MPDIHIDHCSFAYAGSARWALRSLDLTIPQGEFVLLVGPSGCGKSTLALALAGIIPSRIAGHLRGQIYLGERNVSAMDIHEASQHIGMVFQNPEDQLFHLDVESEIAFGPENLALMPSEIERRVSQSLRYTGVTDLRHEEIFALSGGQKQRIAISATLAMLPQVLVLDEPTSDLDPVGTREVLSVLRMLNKRDGMTIVLIEHKIDEIIPWVDRVLLMVEGKIIVDAPPRSAFADLQPWDEHGVAVPQMVRLARSLPSIFQGADPLGVDEAYEALRGTNYAQALVQHSELLAVPSNGSRKNIGSRSLPQGKVYIPNSNESSGNALRSGTQRYPSDATALSSSMLSWEGVDLAYGSKQVLKDINVRVRPEEWLAVIGPNGSGKTSMASLAMGFLSPTHGRICYKDRPVRAGRISQQSVSMAYLFQAADTMLFGATVEQELLFGLKHQRKRQQEQAVALEQILQTIDLVDYRQSNPFHLSFGQRKRLVIGSLLMRHPELLLLDEPTTGQDEGHARAFLQFLQQLRESERLTYVMITHDMYTVASYASRVVVLHNGGVVLDDKPEVVFACVDQLAESNLLPPPIAQLHAQLCEKQALRVVLSVDAFLRLLQPWEVTP